MTTKPLPAGFVKPDTAAKRRLIVNIQGPEKTGKTDWCLRTGPTPVFHIVLDPNGLEVAKKIIRDTGREIYTLSIPYSRNMDQAAAVASWNALWGALEKALQYGSGSVVVDSATELDSLCRLAHFGKLEKVPTFKYIERNKDMQAVMSAVYGSAMNCFFISKQKKQYTPDSKGESAWNGRYELAGWDELPYSVQANLRTRMDEALLTAGEHPFFVHVLVNNMNMDTAGTEYSTLDLPFEMLLDATFPE